MEERENTKNTLTMQTIDKTEAGHMENVNKIKLEYYVYLLIQVVLKKIFLQQINHISFKRNKLLMYLQ